MTYLAGMALSALTAVIVIFGDYILKLATVRGTGMATALVGAGCVLYAISAVCWFWALQRTTLIQASVAFSMLTLLAMAFIGAWFFDEKPSQRELAGMGFACMAMLMMARVG